MAPRHEPYKILGRIGGGAFGEVFQATSRKDKDKKIVAVKRIKMKKLKMDPKKFRESAILNDIKKITHSNIVKILKPVYIDSEFRMCIPMEFFPFNLAEHKGNHRNDYIYDGYENRKAILKGILLGLKQMHDRGIAHRDMKPSNILLDVSVKPPIPKIADFGLSRGSFFPGDELTPMIGTSGYRAPEILLAGGLYDTKVDVWGVGCIFFELLTKDASFVDGQGQIEELNSIFRVIGSPSIEEWPEARSLKYGLYVPNQPTAPIESLEMKLPNATSVEMDLLKKLLLLNPSSRITVDGALAHDYFRAQASTSS